MSICTISAREAQQRIDKARGNHELAFKRGFEGTEALLWFSDYALNTKRDELPGHQVFTLSAQMINTASTKAAIAANYIERAAATYADKILADAMNIARRDMGFADDLARLPERERNRLRTAAR